MERKQIVDRTRSRRRFLKATAAAGSALTGLTAAGTAAAGGLGDGGQENLNLTWQGVKQEGGTQKGLVNIQNVAVLNNINVTGVQANVGDVDVTVIEFDQVTGDIVLKLTDNVVKLVEAGDVTVSITLLSGGVEVAAGTCCACK
jgi:hypothetical protein